MENPFVTTPAQTPTAGKKKYTQIVLPLEIVNKLKNMNKGSMKQTIEYLLGNNADERLLTRMRTAEQEISKLQELLEKIVSVNRLKY
jgi:hypothetical protein